mmetsp:Transcript_6422/g.24888  ORF Transcript_6422/g.24888 Transcript_6422/m.24888 type:complete len:334 (+) Transcript_6422:1847-2848(+)
MYRGARDSRVFVVVFAHRIRDVQTRFPRFNGTYIVGERADVRERQPGVFGHAVVRTEAVVVGERPRDRTGDVRPVPIRVDVVVRYASAHRKLAGLLKRAVPDVHSGVAAPDDLADAGDPSFVKRRSADLRASLHNLRRLPVGQPTQGTAAGRYDRSRRHPLRGAVGSQPVHRRVERAREDADDHLPTTPRDAREGVGVARRGPDAPLKRSSRFNRKLGGCPRTRIIDAPDSSPRLLFRFVRHRGREHGFEEHAARVRVRRDGVLAQKRRDISRRHRAGQLVQHAVPRLRGDIPRRQRTHPRHPRDRDRRRRRRRSPHGDVRRDGDDAGDESRR